MKAVIPVAGVGSRLRPHTHTIPKVLIPVAGKPILGHILDALCDQGVDEVILITGYLGEQVRAFVEKEYSFTAHFVEQEERLGLGHAILLTKEYLGSEPVLIVLGDTIFRADFGSILESGQSMIGVKPVTDPRRFGIVEHQDGWVTRLVEKPDEPQSDLAIVGIYHIASTPLLVECLETIVAEDIRTKGEYQLTDALALMLDRGEKMRVFPIEGWYDCGKLETLLETNRYLLDLNHDCVSIEGSIVIPPVSIHPSVKVERSIVGPYVTIAEGSEIRRSIVSDSIICQSALVENSQLDFSLIGDKAVVRGRLMKLNVGDSSEVDFALRSEGA